MAMRAVKVDSCPSEAGPNIDQFHFSVGEALKYKDEQNASFQPPSIVHFAAWDHVRYLLQLHIPTIQSQGNTMAN